MYRVLKPGGYCFVYTPFLYYYHPLKVLQRFFRFTKDGLEYLFREFVTVEYCNTRGATETVVNLLPYSLSRILNYPARLIDIISSKDKSNQTSGYNLFAV